MLIVLIISFLSWIGLGLFAIQVNNPYDKIKIYYETSQEATVKGLFSVALCFCISFVFGLIVHLFIRKFFKLTLKVSLILSVLILGGLVGYAFYIKLTPLGIVAAILTFLMIYYGVSNFQILSELYSFS